MTEPNALTELSEEPTRKGKDPSSRKTLYWLLALWLTTLAALVGVGFNAYFQEKQKTQTLAQQIRAACDVGDLGPGVTENDEDQICDTAERVIESQPVPSNGLNGRDGKDGVDGTDGRDGVDGTDGRDGRPGRPGEDGTDGSDGVGLDGSNGVDGNDGQNGQNGSPGPPGRDGVDGKDGQDGRDGVDGQDGLSAFPFTFFFTVQNNPIQSTTYQCVLENPEVAVTCTEVE